MRLSSKTRTTLLERIREGEDPVAWDEFWARYWRPVFNFARMRGCSDHTAEEILQDVMLTVFEKHQVFRYDPAKGRFRDWLGGVTRNLVNKRRAKPSERVRAMGDDTRNTLDLVQDPHLPADDLWQQTFEESLLNVLLDLVRREVAPATYQAFELVALEGVSAADAAKVTGLSRNAVYLARKRILKRLRELGESYRSEGRLLDRVKQALASAPSDHVERSLTSWMEQSMSARG
jgi:RNA polymerase sigma-70 factor (ECF subfamily)